MPVSLLSADFLAHKIGDIFREHLFSAILKMALSIKLANTYSIDIKNTSCPKISLTINTRPHATQSPKNVLVNGVCLPFKRKYPADILQTKKM